MNAVGVLNHERTMQIFTYNFLSDVERERRFYRFNVQAI